MSESGRLHRGQEISVEIVGLSAEGEGIAHAEGRELRVPLSIPGERVRVRVLRAGRHPVPTKLLAREEPAPSRTSPACPHFEQGCGGCTWQDLLYPEQLRLKEQLVRANLGALPGERLRPILGMDSPWFYRNKMEFTFGSEDGRPETGGDGCGAGNTPEQSKIENRKSKILLGLHRRGRYWDLVDIVDCRLQSPLADEIRNAVRACAEARDWVPYNKHTHQGELRYLMLREGKRTGEVLVNLVSRSEGVAGVPELAADLAARFPQIASFVWSISPEKGDAIKAHQETLLHGKPRIREILDGIEFLIGPGTFFQTNTAQAERLCALVTEFREAAGHGPEPVILDLYCGVGTFALSTARRAPGARVFGVELVEESVQNARENAERNALPGVEFLAGDVGKRLPEALQAVGTPDMVIVDPPRAGLAPDVMRDLLALGAKQILYVSCNPPALGRDLALLLAGGYTLAIAQPVDMFPHTLHVETVVSLLR